MAYIRFILFGLFTFVFNLTTATEVEHLVPRIISVLPHDVNAFTQGLAIDGDTLYESTGLYGQSSLREINLQNGQVIRQVKLPPHLFAEGIAIVDDQVIQLTWKEKKALIFDRKKLNFLYTIPYQGEGWGLCQGEDALIMSNGTSLIAIRHPHTLAILKQVQATFGRQKLERLNDLECVGDSIYANVWKSDVILRLDKVTGKLTGIIDASKLLTPQEKKRLDSESVLNGIAYHPTRKTFFITGKRWPKLFEVQFVFSNESISDNYVRKHQFPESTNQRIY